MIAFERTSPEGAIEPGVHEMQTTTPAADTRIRGLVADSHHVISESPS